MPRPKEFGLLRPEDHTWLEYLRKRYRNDRAVSNADRQRLFRLRDRFKKVRDDLIYLANTLPEEQQEQMFTAEVFQPFIHNLLGKDLKVNDRTERRYQLARLFADYSLSVCQDRIQSRNPDAWSFTVKAFNDTRTAIWFSIPEKRERTKKYKAKCPKCGQDVESSDVVFRCSCGHKIVMKD